GFSKLSDRRSLGHIYPRRRNGCVSDHWVSHGKLEFLLCAGWPEPCGQFDWLHTYERNGNLFRGLLYRPSIDRWVRISQRNSESLLLAANNSQFAIPTDRRTRFSFQTELAAANHD